MRGALCWIGELSVAESERDFLDKFQTLASIASAIAIPLVIALFGWVIQSKIADQAAQRDYVSLAIGILNNPKNQGNDELKSWAVAVLDKTAPIPFSVGLRQKLATGELVITQTVAVKTLYFPDPPAVLMTPPLEMLPLPSGKVTNGDLLSNTIENYRRFHVNAAEQKYLQQWIRETAAIVNKPAVTPAHSTSTSGSGN